MVNPEKRARRGRKGAQRSDAGGEDRFYRGDIAEEFCAAHRKGGLMRSRPGGLAATMERRSGPTTGALTSPAGHLDAGPALLQSLDILEIFDVPDRLRRRALIHAVYRRWTSPLPTVIFLGDPWFRARPWHARPASSRSLPSSAPRQLHIDRNDVTMGLADPSPFQRAEGTRCADE